MATTITTIKRIAAEPISGEHETMAAEILQLREDREVMFAACKRAEQFAASFERRLGDWDAVDCGHLEAIRNAIEKVVGAKA